MLRLSVETANYFNSNFVLFCLV